MSLISPRVGAATVLLLGVGLSAACTSTPAPTDAGDAQPPGDGPTDGGLPPRPACTRHLTPTGDVQTTVQTALVEAAAGDVLCFDDGTYRFRRPLSLSTQRITLQGTADGAVLDFADQTMGDNSILATGDGFTIQYLTVQNSQANGVRVEGVDGVTFRRVHARWTAGSAMANGAYAVYPVSSGHVLIEDCEVEGAADAGIYVGQSHDVVVRRNNVHGNVAGIEIENCSNSCVYENHAYDNTAGILVFTLPGLAVAGTGHARVHHNMVDGNNRTNFCHPGGIVCDVPVGIGVMVMAADNTELDHNAVNMNDGTGVLVVDFRTQGAAPMGYDPRPENTCIHDNTFAGNGGMPHGILAALANPDSGRVDDILWDGYGMAGHSCANNAVNTLCIRDNGAATFRCGDGPTYADPVSNLAAHACPCTGEACVTF